MWLLKGNERKQIDDKSWDEDSYKILPKKYLQWDLIQSGIPSKQAMSRGALVHRTLTITWGWRGAAALVHGRKPVPRI